MHTALLKVQVQVLHLVTSLALKRSHPHSSVPIAGWIIFTRCGLSLEFIYSPLAVQGAAPAILPASSPEQLNHGIAIRSLA